MKDKRLTPKEQAWLDGGDEERGYSPDEDGGYAPDDDEPPGQPPEGPASYAAPEQKDGTS